MATRVGKRRIVILLGACLVIGMLMAAREQVPSMLGRSLVAALAFALGAGAVLWARRTKRHERSRTAAR